MCKFCQIFKSNFDIENEEISDNEFEYIICSYFSEEKLVTDEQCENCQLKQE